MRTINANREGHDRNQTDRTQRSDEYTEEGPSRSLSASESETLSMKPHHPASDAHADNLQETDRQCIYRMVEEHSSNSRRGESVKSVVATSFTTNPAASTMRGILDTVVIKTDFGQYIP